MARRGCVLGGLGCGLVALLVLGGGSLVFMSLAASGGRPVVGGVDLRPFDVLDVLDAMGSELEPTTMRLLDDGRLELRVDMVRTGDEAWTWTLFEVRDSSVQTDGVALAATGDAGAELRVDVSDLNGPSGRVPLEVVLTPSRVPADGAEVALQLKIKINASRMAGLTNLGMDKSYAVTMGRWGEWYDHRVTPVSGTFDATAPEPWDG